MMRRTSLPRGLQHGLVSLAVAGLALSGCGEEEAPVVSSTHGSKVAVVGTTDCERHVDSDEYLDDGSEVMRETFECDLAMSDPRASGHEVWHIVTTFRDPSDVLARWTGKGTLTNDQGTWTATGGGIIDLTSDGYNQGQQVYVGNDGYEGLTMRVLISGTNANMTYAGWIEPAA